MTHARSLLVGAAAFVAALSFRVANAPVVLAGGIPQIGVLDDLYHFKRMAFTAAHFPDVLEFDVDRGQRGEFCPWPPLYDFAGGTVARLCGASDPGGVLRVVVWIPPLVSALFIGAIAALLALRAGWPAGVAIAIALAASPFLIAESSIGDIDHHYLESVLAVGIAGAMCAAMVAPKRPVAAGFALGVTMTAALFVQSALVIACGLAFFALLLFTDGRAAVIGFSISGLAVVTYRITRAPGFPDSPWFLGWSHAALLTGAAVAAAVWILWRNRSVAIVMGAAATFAAPPVMRSVLNGLHFFGGDPWLATIVEFQPIWRYPAWRWPVVVLAVGGVLASLLLLDAVRQRNALRGSIAAFAIVYLLLTLTSLRFWSVSIPMLALAGALYGARRPIALGALALPAVIHLAMWSGAEPPISSRDLPWLRAANFVRSQTGTGRVLVEWSYGHAFDVIGQRGVIVDGFGTMSDETVFRRAQNAFLTQDEDALMRYCRASDVRFVVLHNPYFGLQGTAAAVGLDPAAFRGTRLAASTWWWRAYYRRSSRHFRLVYVDPQLSWQGTSDFRGPALMIWERTGA